jgi:hypothetical protein
MRARKNWRQQMGPQRPPPPHLTNLASSRCRHRRLTLPSSSTGPAPPRLRASLPRPCSGRERGRQLGDASRHLCQPRGGGRRRVDDIYRTPGTRCHPRSRGTSIGRPPGTRYARWPQRHLPPPACYCCCSSCDLACLHFARTNYWMQCTGSARCWVSSAAYSGEPLPSLDHAVSHHAQLLLTVSFSQSSLVQSTACCNLMCIQYLLQVQF